MLRPGKYLVTGQPVGGDAPKDFIRVYEYGVGRRSRSRTWPAFIAKIGHKWYPAESVTEQLMTRIGETLEIRVAKSQLMHADGQIRFLSRYFLERDEILVHGAQIAAGYLADEEFVHDVEDERAERDIFTFQVLRTAIDTRFPEDKDAIVADLVRMIAFDALVGNQDRHLYNWGVIVHAKGSRRVRFSPIFDTARGLFWNVPDGSLRRYNDPATLKKYVREGHPLIGWDRVDSLNHFDLVSNIARMDDGLRDVLGAIDHASSLVTVGTILDREFSELLSRQRRTLIMRCLERRFELFAQAVEGTSD